MAKRKQAAAPEPHARLPPAAGMDGRSFVSGAAAGAVIFGIIAFLIISSQPQLLPAAPQQQNPPVLQQPGGLSIQPGATPSTVILKNEQKNTIIVNEITIGGKVVSINATLAPGQSITVIYSSSTSGGSSPAGPSGTAPPAANQTPGASGPEPLSIRTTSLPEAKQDARYSTGLEAVGGTGSYSWSVAGLPPGYSSSSSGVISGVTLEHGTYSLVITVSDGQSSQSEDMPLVVSE